MKNHEHYSTPKRFLQLPMENRKKKSVPIKLGSKSVSEPESDPDTNIWSFITKRSTVSWFFCVSLFAVLIRLSVALHPYSGAHTPPMFGDYEAQRHWMEITVNLPVKEWYRNSTANDLRYWGLDYPPLTAYQSYFHGILLKYFDPASVSLFTSRGYESYLGKLLMRWTVLMSDLMIFFPAVLYFVTVYYSGKPTGDKSSMAWHTVMILLNPCLILIDHGHFQRPCRLPAVLSCSQPQTGAFLPKMSAYYAPAFFAYLLGKCLRRQNPILEVLKLGLVVLGTFALVWWPYLYSVDASLELELLFVSGMEWDRICIQAGKSANFDHCRACSILDGSFSLSPLRESTREIHPASASASKLLGVGRTICFRWLIYCALLSMFPLIRRDNLVLPYGALYGLFVLLYYAPDGRKNAKRTDCFSSILESFAFACSLFLHVIYMTITPPDKYPFLFEAVIMMFCFSQFVWISIYQNTKQWALSKTSSPIDAKKKSL
ncbi:hypothetical protein DH2020_015909 [Rehmannia glutinosa]|uniref:Alpha-1,3-glucosyltransferase n=1 Tax=Rehmannia glutinosa TaxID=99300 RepID=A0ABR0WTZ2_REHGL